MGDKVYPPPHEVPRGVDCFACTPGAYHSGQWPSILYATFTGITACPGYPDPPNNHHFKLTQSPAGCDYDCHEKVGPNSWFVSLELSHANPPPQIPPIVSQIYLYCEDPILGTFFLGWEAMCTMIFPLNLLGCLMDAGEGGSAIVQETPTPIRSYLCGQCHLLPHLTTLSERQIVALDHSLVRLANKQGKSCIYVYFDDEDLPN